MTGSDPKQIARELLEEAHPALIGLSHWIHANPELGYQEVLASGWVTEWLTTAGFDVRTGVAGMPTAVVGSYGPGPFHVAVCVEYDALPAVGHACGHNVIAAAGVGAGLALAAVADQLGLRVTVLGTPAEETGGGKIGMIKAGELDGVHAAMMVHPWPDDQAAPPVIAIRSLNVAYTGTAAHAAGYPHLGVNAADALVVAQTAIALLRQQLRPTDRVHGIVTKGGDAANIIPARTEAQWMVRGTNVARLDEVTALVRRCFEAGALATGATLEIQEEICYADVRHDADLARLYQSNAESLGRVFSAPGMPLSTDMGNVSYVVPTIHPMIGVEANGAVNHQADFAAACATPSADQAILDGALAMAWTAIDAAQDEGLRRRLMEFRADPAEVAMVSSAWMMPPLAAAAVQLPAAEEVVEIIEVEVETAEADLVAEAELVAEVLVAEAVLELDPVWTADADAAADPVADTDAEPEASLDPDTAWAADVDAVAQQMVAVGLLQDPGAGPMAGEGEGEAEDVAAEPTVDEAGTVELDEPVAEMAFAEAAAEPAVDEAGTAELVEPVSAEPAVDEVLFVGFDEAAAVPVAEVVVLAAAEDDAADAQQVLDVWVTPEVLGEWLDAPADAVAEAVAADPEPAGEPASDMEPVTDEQDIPGGTWFATEVPADEMPLAEAPPAPAAPVIAAPVVAAASLRDRDAWERAFEEAAARIGWEEQFEAAINERISVERMDRSEAIADLASDLQEAAEERDEVAVAAAWPPQERELMSRERIEAEGFSFVAPEVASPLDELTDVWSRNGNGADHAGEDVRLR